MTPFDFPLVPLDQKITAALNAASVPTYLGGVNGAGCAGSRTFQFCTFQPPTKLCAGVLSAPDDAP